MQEELSKQVIQGISRAHQALKLYPLQHPSIKKQVQDCLAALAKMFQKKNRIKMGMIDETLFFDENLFATPSDAEQEILNIFKTMDIEALEWRSGVTHEELLQFFELTRSGKVRGEDLEDAFLDAGIHHIRLSQVDMPEEDSAKEPKKIYNRAVKVLDNIFQDVRLGKIPSSEEAAAVIKEMAELTISDPDALFALSMIKDYDNYTFTHSVNVSVISLMVGRSCGLDIEELQTLGLGGLLHDLGKLNVDLEIITKPGRLNRQEFEIIKQHPVSGADMVKQMQNIPPAVIDIVLCHHLRYNREGYPADARGKKLSPLVDMVTIADAYDAMTTLRSYQRPVSPRKALAKLQAEAGISLHPKEVENFILSLGRYPVGTLVRLDTNEIGLVTQVNVERKGDLQMDILFDSSGTQRSKPGSLHLTEDQIHRIIAEVDPFVKGIDVASYLN
ncbi:MAG TPA: HD domain-containing phosphohydrolase [Desulfuromonadales bacterium]|nr:HD domain-containing phosphohydrolase [Desulfuromonadales bacterium]